MAARIQLRVKADWETRSATTGGFSAAVSKEEVEECVSGESLLEPTRFLEARRRGRKDDPGAAAKLLAAPAVACLYTTPSSSRKYAGPIFLFSALHCARTRRRRRFAELLGGSGVASRGSGKKKEKSGLCIIDGGV